MHDDDDFANTLRQLDDNENIEAVMSAHRPGNTVLKTPSWKHRPGKIFKLCHNLESYVSWCIGNW